MSYTESIGALWPLGIPVAQSWREIGASLMAIQELKIATYIEIGIHRGGLASLLIARCRVTPLHYYGIEISRKIIDPALRTMARRVARAQITIGDVFKSDWVQTCINAHDGPCLVLCDGGDKPREVALVARLLRPGDYLMAHDFGTEIYEADLPPTLERLRPAWLDRCRLALCGVPR